MAQAHPGVLTDVGTNELEVVEFVLDDRPYVINVAKVREIIPLRTVMPVPEAHPHVLGLFRNRDDVLPLVDLGGWLGGEAEPDPKLAKIIVAEFNKMKVGFLVHGVRRIHRVSWQDLESPGHDSMMDSRTALGFMRLGGESEGGERIVFLLDFERIVTELEPPANEALDPEAEQVLQARHGRVVLVAEDSNLIRGTMVRRLEAGGYTVVATTNGAEAWDTLDAGGKVDAVVTDIEMPRMDGHHLTRRIRGDQRFQGMPVVLYSSMIHEEMHRKGESVGADAQLCKPDLPHLLTTVDGLLLR